ncbi:MAG TPA: flagellar hook-length control protein FliK [Firmicutes bacterium]|nr:flagellar hook-length control protein FliK [Bacillota bacterium]
MQGQVVTVGVGFGSGVGSLEAGVSTPKPSVVRDGVMAGDWTTAFWSLLLLEIGAQGGPAPGEPVQAAPIQNQDQDQETARWQDPPVAGSPESLPVQAQIQAQAQIQSQSQAQAEARSQAWIQTQDQAPMPHTPGAGLGINPYTLDEREPGGAELLSAKPPLARSHVAPALVAGEASEPGVPAREAKDSGTVMNSGAAVKQRQDSVEGHPARGARHGAGEPGAAQARAHSRAHNGDVVAHQAASGTTGAAKAHGERGPGENAGKIDPEMVQVIRDVMARSARIIQGQGEAADPTRRGQDMAARAPGTWETGYRGAQAEVEEQGQEQLQGRPLSGTPGDGTQVNPPAGSGESPRGGGNPVVHNAPGGRDDSPASMSTVHYDPVHSGAAVAEGFPASSGRHHEPYAARSGRRQGDGGFEAGAGEAWAGREVEREVVRSGQVTGEPGGGSDAGVYRHIHGRETAAVWAGQDKGQNPQQHQDPRQRGQDERQQAVGAVQHTGEISKPGQQLDLRDKAAPEPLRSLANEVVAQVVERAGLRLREGRTEMTVQLRPDYLGRIHIRITDDAGILTAGIRTESEAARALIEAGLPQLKTSLASQGFNIEQFTVFVGPGHGAPQFEFERGGRWQDMGQREGSRPGGGAVRKLDVRAIGTAWPPASRGGAGLIDYAV